MPQIITVFGSSAPWPDSPAYNTAQEAGRLLAEAGFAVATGGYGGTMAAVSQGAAEAGGHVIGVGSARIEQYRGVGLNQWVREAVRYDDLTTRLLHLVRQNDGMLALPGGIGTLSEIALAWSLLQVGELGPRPLVLLGDNWRRVFRAVIADGYVKDPDFGLLQFAPDPQTAVAYLTEWSVP